MGFEMELMDREEFEVLSGDITDFSKYLADKVIADFLC